MDLYQIEYFLAIANYGGFSIAAEHLNVSQPSLSNGIKKLEKELGVMLFERGGRRALLTPAGHSFVEQAENIRQQYQTALSKIRDFQARPVLRLGVICTFRIGNIMQLVSRFRTRYPHIAIELRDGHIDKINHWLNMGKIDLALTVLKPDEPPETSLHLLEQQLKLAVPETHPFAEQEVISVAELDGQPYIKRINCEFWRESPQIYESAGVSPHVVYIANQEEWVIYLIEAGLGISIMPQWHEVSGIKYVAVEELNISRTIGLKWRRHQELELVNLFLDFTDTQDRSQLLT
ncbi:MAG: LysR family transcriptional regulator [Pleurocapsa sp. MO_226.B13]|nr:LysR family transcriptional regulator [Pleurocapsa sp. MO_226.B13]